MASTKASAIRDVPPLLFDVHSGDKGIVNFVGMADGLVDEQRAFAVMNNLMNFHNPSASIIEIYGDRFDTGIEDGPLPGPILANAFMTIDEAAFHAVRPHHVRLHPGEDGIDIAGVEIAVGAFKEFAFRGHACTPFGFGVWIEIGRGKEPFAGG